MPSAVLERHPEAACSALRGIRASVSRAAAGGLQVAFVLDGDIERVRVPSARPARVAEGLWRHTCCEIFVARPGAPGYREFNLSPSGERIRNGSRRPRSPIVDSSFGWPPLSSSQRRAWLPRLAAK